MNEAVTAHTYREWLIAEYGEGSPLVQWYDERAEQFTRNVEADFIERLYPGLARGRM